MRSSGILLHISSLPSPYGIGTLGEEARNFVDFLVDAKQTYWQLLPIGPTGVGDSPYQSCSVYAGNPYFIDLRELLKEGLLEADELADISFGDAAERVNYSALSASRTALLDRAYDRGKEKYKEPFAAFREKNAWVEEYGLYLSLKRLFGGLPWNQWPQKVASREPEALERYRLQLREDISSFAFTQFIFSLQWERLHAYAAEKGIRIIGDMPIYVPMDSVDAWMYPELFELDEMRNPIRVAGCPPDAFSEDGQLWGNPLYDWAAMKKTGYTWWQERVRAASAFFDVIRIDHFRGLESYWAIPHGDDTAKNGEWVKGPGLSLIRAIQQAVPHMQFIAEDLGFLTPAVLKLQKASGFPGMKVLEFAFDGSADNPYLPHLHIPTSICYTSTHDNETLRQWLEHLDTNAYAFVKAYLGLNEEEGDIWGLLRAGMGSVADTFVAQLQDYLELGAEARMNVPGTVSAENWSWRLTEMPPAELSEKIAEMTARYDRAFEK